jgi:hypothetical protein
VPAECLKQRPRFADSHSGHSQQQDKQPVALVECFDQRADLCGIKRRLLAARHFRLMQLRPDWATLDHVVLLGKIEHQMEQAVKMLHRVCRNLLALPLRRNLSVLGVEEIAEVSRFRRYAAQPGLAMTALGLDLQE